MKRMLLFVACFLTLQATAQSDWQDALHDWMTTEEADEGYGEETMELLQELSESKINLNQTSRQELEQLPFLTAQQIEDLVEYIDRYRPLRTMNELLMLESLDPTSRELLQHFVYIGGETPRRTWPTLADVKKYGKHTLMATAKIPLYRRQGDKRSAGGYLGYPYRHDIRYQFTYGNRVKFGLTGGQDAGEPFFSNKNWLGYDHYSYYFQLRQMGRLEELNVGHYRVQMGMGLVMNTGFHMGKLTTLQAMGRSTHVLTAHSSRSAMGYLQGAAATVRLKPRWTLTAFASYRPVDATLNDNASARTIVTDGYHRTNTELLKKNNTHEVDAGCRMAWRATVHGGQASVAFNSVFTHFDRRLQPQQTVDYRQYALAGNDFLNVSIDYGYVNHRLSFNGETALNRSGAMAAIHAVSYRLTDTWTAMLLHRYYGLRYTSYHAHSFSEGSGVQNEHGIYGALTWAPSRKLVVRAYADYAHFPGPRYQVSLPSDAFDALLHARVYNNRCNVEVRYRFHLRQRNNSNKTLLQNRYEHRARLRLTVDPRPMLSLQTQADGAIVETSETRSRGIMVSQQAAWTARWLHVDANVGWFHTDDYDSRLYQYERSVLYDFSFPMYYGHGIRYALRARAILGNFTLTAKVGVTDYFDRSVISTGLQHIDGSSQPDILLQLRYKF